jgi:hypothetical protein
MSIGGKVYWSEHPTNFGAPGGHKNAPGEGELVAFGSDEFGHPCGVVETESGAFLTIRLATLRRHPRKEAEAEGTRDQVAQTEGQSSGGDMRDAVGAQRDVT